MEDFVKKLQKTSLEEPENCEEIDIQKFEEIGQHFAQNIEEFIVNIDMEKSQFDLGLLFEEAGRIGMDFGDLEEYGFDTSSACANGACLNRNSFKDLDDALQKGSLFSINMME